MTETVTGVQVPEIIADPEAQVVHVGGFVAPFEHVVTFTFAYLIIDGLTAIWKLFDPVVVQVIFLFELISLEASAGALMVQPEGARSEDPVLILVVLLATQDTLKVLPTVAVAGAVNTTSGAGVTFTTI